MRPEPDRLIAAVIDRPGTEEVVTRHFFGNPEGECQICPIGACRVREVYPHGLVWTCVTARPRPGRN